MKARTGFVSNSSSSSFVAVGFEVPIHGDELMEFLERNYKLGLEPGQSMDNWEIEDVIQQKTGLTYYGDGGHWNGGANMVGYRLAYGLDDGTEDGRISIEEAVEKVREVSEDWNFGTPIQIFWGAYPV